MKPLVIFACGNASRGDDALGPLLIEALEEEGHTCVQDFQLNIEHALDLVDCELALFIDADVSPQGPYRFERLQAAAFPHYSTHALPPDAVLAVYEKMQGKNAPPAFVLGVKGEAFALGTGLSAAAERNLAAAKQLLEQLLARPEVAYWDAVATEASHA